MASPRSRLRQALLALAAGLLLSGCGSVRYYAHVTHGQAWLLLHRRPISKVQSDPRTAPAIASKLQLAMQARRFAIRRLGLPDNRSYTTYVQLDRPFVAWNVFVTPPYSVEPVTQCFPIAGCVAYRGWFDRSHAERDASHWRERGDDTWIGPVPAYSTLGWFADPLLSSMLRWDDDELAGTIFHELAHQRLYVPGDTAFNEAYASFVQHQGVREWRRARGLPPADVAALRMQRGFTRLVLQLRSRLKATYAQVGEGGDLAALKAACIEDFRERYRRWRDARWPGHHEYDAWVEAPINNAKLVPFGLYDAWEPAFATLFARCNGDWAAFHARVRAWAALPAERREQAVRALLPVDDHAADGS